MRGKLARHHAAEHGRRIIPAHAGQTPDPRCLRERSADHPRTCGANERTDLHNARSCGSSPHMRGKPVGAHLPSTQVRIIPAHAGQTSHQQSGTTDDPDHPRTCGANRPSIGTNELPTGSSPHMRGKHPARRRGEHGRRIIPAHAGQTPSPHRRPRTWTDHPRTCGANALVCWLPLTVDGSSPHMRGKLPIVSHSRSGCRIIPAHAGQTASQPSGTRHTSDHPRTCGANSGEYPSIY